MRQVSKAESPDSALLPQKPTPTLPLPSAREEGNAGYCGETLTAPAYTQGFWIGLKRNLKLQMKKIKEQNALKYLAKLIEAAG